MIECFFQVVISTKESETVSLVISTKESETVSLVISTEESEANEAEKSCKIPRLRSE